MAELSKVKIGSQVYDLKDAKSRQDLLTLIGSHGLTALGTAAWVDTVSEVKDGATGLPTNAAVKNYVDAQVGAIHKFDVVVAGALPTASADTMYKLYLIPASGSVTQNIKKEYITVRSGSSESDYTYAWELIGDTAVDLSGYVQKTRKIAGIDLQDDITVEELSAENALNLKALAHKESASGTVAGQTISGVTATGTSTGEISVVLDQTSTAASLTTGDYTPAGEITGTAISDGSINVTLKDAATAAEASVTTKAYTPTGTVTAANGGTFQALKTATFGEDSANGVQIEGEVSAPTISLTAESKDFVTGLTGGSVASFDVSKFNGGSAASLGAGFYTAGSDASLTGGSQATLTAQTKDNFATKILKPAIDTTDSEMLVFNYVDANTEASAFAEAVTDRGTFTANELQTLSGGKATVIDTTKFNGGAAASMSDDIFTANTLQSASTGSVNDVTAAALASNPVFTGKKYKIATTDDTAMKSAVFTATNSANIVDKVTYFKQEVDKKEFTPVAATLGFAGTTSADILVTGVNYDKASVNAAGTTFTGKTITLNVGDITVAEKTVTVE